MYDLIESTFPCPFKTENPLRIPQLTHVLFLPFSRAPSSHVYVSFLLLCLFLLSVVWCDVTTSVTSVITRFYGYPNNGVCKYPSTPIVNYQLSRTLDGTAHRRPSLRGFHVWPSNRNLTDIDCACNVITATGVRLQLRNQKPHTILTTTGNLTSIDNSYLVPRTSPPPTLLTLTNATYTTPGGTDDTNLPTTTETANLLSQTQQSCSSSGVIKYYQSQMRYTRKWSSF